MRMRRRRRTTTTRRRRMRSRRSGGGRGAVRTATSVLRAELERVLSGSTRRPSFSAVHQRGCSVGPPAAPVFLPMMHGERAAKGLAPLLLQHSLSSQRARMVHAHVGTSVPCSALVLSCMLNATLTCMLNATLTFKNLSLLPPPIRVEHLPGIHLPAMARVGEERGRGESEGGAGEEERWRLRGHATHSLLSLLSRALSRSLATHARTHARTHACMHARTHAHTPTHTHTHTQHACTHTSTHARTHARSLSVRTPPPAASFYAPRERTRAHVHTCNLGSALRNMAVQKNRRNTAMIGGLQAK